jgi:hypothetical protein
MPGSWDPAVYRNVRCHRGKNPLNSDGTVSCERKRRRGATP